MNNKMEKLKKNLLIGCTGSVATIKLPALINVFTKQSSPFEFKVIKHIVNINIYKLFVYDFCLLNILLCILSVGCF